MGGQAEFILMQRCTDSCWTVNTEQEDGSGGTISASEGRQQQNRKLPQGNCPAHMGQAWACENSSHYDPQNSASLPGPEQKVTNRMRPLGVGICWYLCVVEIFLILHLGHLKYCLGTLGLIWLLGRVLIFFFQQAMDLVRPQVLTFLQWVVLLMSGFQVFAVLFRYILFICLPRASLEFGI